MPEIKKTHKRLDHFFEEIKLIISEEFQGNANYKETFAQAESKVLA